jgi:glycosyltransferase involved in cell wall biosynthesis
MKRLLVLNFFPAFVPPGSGGELRYFNLYRKLCAYYDVTLLSPTYSHHKEEVVEHTNTFREYRVPKERIHDQLHMEIDKEAIGMEVSALVCALSARHPNKYHQKYLELYPKSDLIIHDFPYMLDYDLFFGFDDKPRIYNSHNHESSLVRKMWSGPNSKKYMDYVTRLEGRLVSKSDLVFATSDAEKMAFVREFYTDPDKIKIAPNGINPDELKCDRKYGISEKIRAFFIGSAHPPNIEAVDFIIHEVSERCPEIDFYIAGSCCEKYQGTRNPNVYLLGRIDQGQKNELFRSAGIAINPMFSGAGINLKTLEYLSSGIPLVSTTVGVRGLEIVDGEHFILVERDDFAEKLKAVVGNSKLLGEIARRGQEYVDTHYSWVKIAEHVHGELEKVTAKRKKDVILLLNDYEVSNPVAGGEVRINKLYASLSQYYRILLFCLNNDGIIKHSEITSDFTEISFPKTAEHLSKELKMNSRFWVSVTDIVNSEMCLKNELLVAATACIGSKAHVVIFSHSYLGPLIDTFESEHVIYESHNCEYELKKSLLQGHPDYRNLVEQVEEIEKKIAQGSQWIVSVSDDDRECLAKLVPPGKKIVTIQNGVEIKEENLCRDYSRVKEGFRKHPVIIFIGSGHKPNVDALSFIVDHVAPKLRHCYFAIIGTVCNALRRAIPPNVLLFGKLSEDYKDVLLRIADVAINPILSGSGSNLKLAEYFANKIPVVTTSIGARGYSIEDSRHAIICDKRDFSDKILELLNNKELRAILIENAFSYVKKDLDWQVLAKQFQHVLTTQLSSNEKKRLLVVTYRFTNPPLGGAELYLFNVIKELNRLGHFIIDVATLDIHDVYNEFHFSTKYTLSSDYLVLPEAKNIFVLKFKADELLKRQKYQNAAELFTIWMREFVESSLRHMNLYTEPILMGGWHIPEKAAGGVEIWSSGESLIYVEGVEEMEVAGWSPEKRGLKVFGDEGLLFEREVNGRVHLQIPIKDAKVLRFVINPMLIENVDPRPLGIRVSNITYRKGRERKELRLDYQYRDFLKERYLDQYINEMIRIARCREAKVDDLFQSTRGPISSEIEEWLDRNVEDYDIILGHSIPFQTSVLAVKYAKKHRVPVVLLPHFHYDDEFYHWNSYYRALQEADAVIAPEEAVRSFYHKIQASTWSLPGGGILMDEFENVDSSAFKKIYSSSHPFVLCLGRKSGAKNYRWIIEAVKEVNRNKKMCNLVIIGRDEDDVPISEAEAIYLGEQPREIVLGAFKECFCLVNMSESESFGIVILEAWMLEKAVIVNENCPAFSDLVRDNFNGRLSNRESLSGTLSHLLQNARFAVELGRNGRASVDPNYSWKNIGETIDTHLLELLGSRAVPEEGC